MTEVSSTRLYLGNLPRNDYTFGHEGELTYKGTRVGAVVFPATKQDVEDHFNTHGAGKIKEIKLKAGFGFIEYDDEMDAKDVVPAFHGSNLKGQRLTVQFARGPRPRETWFPPIDRSSLPRPRRTIFRMQISGLPETSWQDLKDFARQSGLDVVYSEAGRDPGRGFVEFETAADLKTAVAKLDGREFKGASVFCVADIQPYDDKMFREPYRSRSPLPRRYLLDDYGKRFPPRYSPRMHYRERSPIPLGRDYYSRDAYGRRTPPRPRIDDYAPPRRPYDDLYDARPPLPPRRFDDSYLADRPYRGRTPPIGYDRRGYW